jgi:hypothetical protein
VTCREDLVGELRATARCEVVVSATNSFEPIVTVTAADGEAVDYAMTPAVSKSQLEAVVSRLVGGSGEFSVRAVSCESGIEGTLGATESLRSREPMCGRGAPWRCPPSTA